MHARLKDSISPLSGAGLFAVITFSLMSGSALAHDDKGNDNHYDHSGAPHETPHQAEPPTGGHANLAAAATNPIANLVQFQLQDQYNWDNHKSSGYSNQFLIQRWHPLKCPLRRCRC